MHRKVVLYFYQAEEIFFIYRRSQHAHSCKNKHILRKETVFHAEFCKILHTSMQVNTRYFNSTIVQKIKTHTLSLQISLYTQGSHPVIPLQFWTYGS